MRLVIQRVTHASVSIDGRLHAAIGPGLLVLVGMEQTDTQADADWLARKTAQLRIFNDAQGVMNCDITAAGGDALVVSQFTLYASYRKGNRPSWFRAATHDVAIPLYQYFCDTLGQLIGRPVATGQFGADMQVSLLNDGPVTICMDSKNRE